MARSQVAATYDARMATPGRPTTLAVAGEHLLSGWLPADPSARTEAKRS